MKALNVTSDNFENEVLKSDIPVLVDFWAEWCAPCRSLASTIDKLAETESSIKVCKVNVDEQPELATKYRIMGIPALLVFKHGEVVNKSTGVVSKEKILAMIEP